MAEDRDPLLEGDNRPSVYWEAPWWIIRCSALGGCEFELIAAGQGYERLDHPPNLLRAFREGKERERVAIAKMREAGWQIWGEQDEYELLIRMPEMAPDGTVLVPGIKVRWHPDGLGTINTMAPPALVEVKWLTDPSWRRAARHSVGDIVHEYPWQLSIMMHGYKQDHPKWKYNAYWVAGNKGFPPDPETGVKPYCEDQDRLHYEHVVEPPIDLATIRDKAIRVVDAIMGDDLIGSGMTCTNPGQWPCLYRHFLPPEEDDAPPNPNEITLLSDDPRAELFNDMVAAYLRHKGTMDEAEKLMKEEKDKLLALAKEVYGSDDLKALKYIQTERWKVPFVQGASGGGLDWASMPPELKRAIEKYQKPKKSYDYMRDIRSNG